MDYTTTALLASIKRRALLPSSQSTFQTADFLAIANEELQSHLVPWLMSTREDYFVFAADFTISADASTPYRIPTRAIGSKLRDVYRVDSAGNLSSLPLIELDDIEGRTDFAGYIIQGSSILLVGNAAAAGGTLRVLYYIRPNELRATADCNVISAIDRAQDTVTLSAAPVSRVQGTLTVDLVSATPSFEIQSAGISLTEVTQVGLLSYQTESALPANLAVGDYFCLPGDSPVPNLPAELHPILAQRVAIKCLEALGDSEGLTNAQRQLAQMQDLVMGVVEQRVDGSPRKIKGGILWARPAYFRGGW